jgi:RNA polymerase sigma factor (sigma-70 family)
MPTRFYESLGTPRSAPGWRIFTLWLCRVVINESLRICRRQRLEYVSAVSGAVPNPKPIEPPHQQIDLRESVEAALEKLPENLRTVVVLRVMESLKGKDVARLLGITPVAVTRLLGEAMERLRDHLLDWQPTLGETT